LIGGIRVVFFEMPAMPGELAAAHRPALGQMPPGMVWPGLFERGGEQLVNEPMAEERGDLVDAVEVFEQHVPGSNGDLAVLTFRAAGASRELEVLDDLEEGFGLDDLFDEGERVDREVVTLLIALALLADLRLPLAFGPGPWLAGERGRFVGWLCRGADLFEADGIANIEGDPLALGLTRHAS
jgi:hypothetical protein